ncbi:MAG: DNA translocase FtsK [Chloroflexi bacterium]|nr:DNA translocase FtsK [Chloroflexota bacterium]
MAKTNHKPRSQAKSKEKKSPPPASKSSKPQKPPEPRFKLDWDRWEEITAIAIIILGVLTGLGAFNLSGGFLLSSWTLMLQALFGWGVYLTPIILLGLGAWLFADSLNKTWNIGWERPIGLGIFYFALLNLFHIIADPANPLHEPIVFSGGGYIGWFFVSLAVNAFGEVGTLIAIFALMGIALILLFNISLPEFIRRLVYLGYVMRHLPSEFRAYRQRRSGQPIPAELQPPIDYPQINPPPKTPAIKPTPVMRQQKLPKPPPPPPDEPDVRPSRSAPVVEEKPKEEFKPLPTHGPVAARIIGGNTPAPAPVIQREWRLPEWQTMLEENEESGIQREEIEKRYKKIEETLAHFGVPAKVHEVNQGPAITQFGVEPGFVDQKGPDGKVNHVKVKVSRIVSLQHDLELALAAAPIRIEAPIPGKNMVGVEVPNEHIRSVSLREVMESEDFKKSKSKLRIALGQDVAGQPVSDDLAKMPHLLIAGATGSGKSVCVNAIIACLMCNTTPDEVKFIMIDPKRVELVNFNGIDHLMQPVVVDMDKAVAALQGAVGEMDRRFKIFAKVGARNIDIYHHMIEGKPDAERLPFMIVIVDELADLMMISPEEVERAITRLAQMARATGIHLILATQRPSVDVVTGLIKANFPSRISFAVTSQVDSRVVLDTPGAEKLLGRGDMLYMASDSSKLLRLQGCFVSDRELEKLVSYWKEFTPAPAPTQTLPSTAEPKDEYLQTPLFEGLGSKKKEDTDEDDLLPQAIEVVQQSNRASISLLQRKLKVGYSRAARLIELLEKKGIVGPDGGPTKGRPVIVPGNAPSKPSKSRATAASSDRKFEEGDDFSDFTDEDWEELDGET